MKKDIYEVPAHQYGFAGLMNNIAGNPDENGKLTSGPFAGMSGSVAGGLGALGTAVGGMVGTAIAGGRESTAGNVIDGLSNVASAIPGPWGAVAGAGLKVIGGLTNAAFGVKLNQENINNINNNIASMNGFQSNAGSFDSLTENFNSQPTMMSFNQDYIGKNGWFNKGATKKFNQLQAQQQTAQQFVNNSLTNNLNNLVMGQNQSLLANYAAKGGPLMTQGTEWNTGLNYIGEGGSHEQNPNGGIQQGIAPDGLPNLVEEGEVVWNGDYVFSKRLKVNKSFKKKYKLGREDKPLSYADAALIFNKEMEERPNDVISKRGRDANLARLAESQEEKRAKIQSKEQRQQALLNMLSAPQEGLSEQNSDMPEEPGMSIEQPVEERMSPEQYMEQQSATGMPLESMYSAKGGPIGHKFAKAGAKPNVSDEVANWWRQIWKGIPIDTGGYDIYDWLNDLQILRSKPSKDNMFPLTRMLSSNLKTGKNLPKGTAANFEDVLAYANSGNPGDISKFLNLAYEERNVSEGNYPRLIKDAFRPKYNSDWKIYSNGDYIDGLNTSELELLMAYPDYALKGLDAIPTDKWGNAINPRRFDIWSSPQKVAETLVPTSLDWNDLTKYRHNLASIPQRFRDEQGNILYDENGNVKTVPNQYEQIKTNPAQGRYEFNKETGKLGYVPPTTAQLFGLQTPRLELSPEIRDYATESLINNGNAQLLIDAQKRNPIVANVPETTSDATDGKGNAKFNYPLEGHLRYMPAIGSGLAFFGDLLNLTNRPDYSAADAISRSTRGLRDVRFTPLGDYAKYTPVDRMLALNQLGAAAGANRRALMNQTAGNRGTAMASLLAADNNFMNNIGTTLFTADNANYDRYMKALAHNADINKSNSTGFLQADMANQRMDEVRARYNTLAADARMKALQLASANRSANYNNFFDNLGNIGIDALNRADARWLAQYWAGANAPSSRYGYAKCGGKLNKRRRRTII